VSKNEHGLFHARSRRGLPILLSALLTSASISALTLIPGQAQAGVASTWQGGTSSDYNDSSNWNNGAPISSGSAVFGTTGNTNVAVSSAVSPDGWTFGSSSQSYSITGSAVTLGSSGIVDSASGQNVFIANNLGGSGGVTIDTTARMALSGFNSYTGATTVNSGATLTAGSTGAFSASSDFTVNGTLDLGGFNNSIGSLSGNAGGIITNNGSAAATLTVGGNNGRTNFGGTLQDGSSALALEVTGTGSLTLTGNSTNTGITNIDSAATLELGNGGSSGDLGTGAIADNGTLVFNRGDLVGYVIITNDISGTGGLEVVGTAAPRLSGNNTYGGATVIDPGKGLEAGSSTGLSPNSNFIVAGTLDLQGYNNSIGSLTGAGIVTSNGSSTDGGNTEPTATLTVGNLNASTTFSGILEDGTDSIYSQTTTLALDVIGGSLTLTGANTYSGGTIITGGTLQVSGSGTLGEPDKQHQ
jgi:autotransporter-associated beta strand protein